MNDGRRDELRPVVHGGMAVGGDTRCAVAGSEFPSLATKLWESEEVMRLNAELGLAMDQLVRLARAILKAQPEPFEKRCYVMSEPHLSGARVIVGFESRDDADAAHAFLVSRPNTN